MKSRRLPILSRVTAVAAALALSAPAQAAEDGLRLSGFASLVLGKTIGGTSTTLFPQQQCPCFVADWSHNGVYGPHWSFSEESRAGVQLDYRFGPTLSATAQVVARGQDGGSAALEWAFLSWQITPAWQFQAGRKRLPLYFYSDFQDVGFAYPWVRVPADVYGWDIVNYDGANLSYTAHWNDWSLRANAYAGSSTSKDNPYSRMYYTDPQDVRWKAMRGVDLEVSRDWLTLRANYHRSRASQFDRGTGAETIDPANNLHTAWGVALNADLDPWWFRIETGRFDRSRYAYDSGYYMASVGYRIGDFTPWVAVSRYADRYEDPSIASSTWRTVGMGLRWDLRASTALKLQYETLRNTSPDIYNGDAKQLTLALDYVF